MPICSVQFTRSVMSSSLQPHGLQHTRLPCPSSIPWAYSNSCPSSQWCHPTTSSSVVPFLLPPSIFPSIRVFSSESVLRIRWPKYWSFSFSISLFNEYSGLISFRMDWLDLLIVQVTLKSLLQHHSSKASFKSYHMDLLIHSRSVNHNSSEYCHIFSIRRSTVHHPALVLPPLLLCSIQESAFSSITPQKICSLLDINNMLISKCKTIFWTHSHRKLSSKIISSCNAVTLSLLHCVCASI